MIPTSDLMALLNKTMIRLVLADPWPITCTSGKPAAWLGIQYILPRKEGKQGEIR